MKKTKAITHREYSRGKKTLNLSLPEVIKKTVDKESWVADEYIAPSIPKILQKTMRDKCAKSWKSFIGEITSFFKP
jgi:hypothetical protein